MKTVDRICKQFENDVAKAEEIALKPIKFRIRQLFRFLRKKYDFEIIMGMGGYNLRSNHEVPVKYSDDSEGPMSLNQLQYWFDEEGGKYVYTPRNVSKDGAMSEDEIEKFIELCLLCRYVSSEVHYYFDLK